MGHIKTSKLDSGAIGFECIYGGVEAPFGGIDASKAPRYIDPRCFADASNFLIVDNELCICNLFPATLPANGITYPYVLGPLLASIPDPAILVGVGVLPCEGIVKNWALYTCNTPDSSNLIHYRLILWTDDSTTVETYNMSFAKRTKISTGTQATATFQVLYHTPITAEQTAPAVTLLPIAGSGAPTVHISDMYGVPTPLFYEISIWAMAIGGVPTGTGPTDYLALLGATTTTFLSIFNASSGGAPPLPTPLNYANAMVTVINATPKLPYTASVIAGTTQILLTAHTPSGFISVDGSAGNSLVVNGTNGEQGYGFYANTTGVIGSGSFQSVDPTEYSHPNPFSQQSFDVLPVFPFSGGTDPGQILYQDLPIQELTWETVGDKLFLAGYPAGYMLQFDNTKKQFGFLTQYEGARVLKKMAGHLISAGLVDGYDTVSTNANTVDPHLWFSWSAPFDYSQWDPLDTSNLQTGAGGTQLADISDMLTGLIVSNSVAFILRAEGLSYATVIPQSAQLPFDFNHVALCKEGQGCPSTALWTQFDQIGFYVGTSNIFMLQQSPQAIGDKIIGGLFPDLINQTNIPPIPPNHFFDVQYQQVNVEPLTILINNRPITLFATNIAGKIYVLSPQDQTWMKLYCPDAFPTIPGIVHQNVYKIMKCICLPANGYTGYGGSFQYKASYIYFQEQWTIGVGDVELQAPLLYQFLPKISPTQTSYVIFPAEEISHGRDITIDAVYATISGLPGTVVVMTVSGWQGNPSTYVKDAFFGVVTLDTNAIPDQYEEYQFFNSDGSAITLKAPQLKLWIQPQTVPAYTPPLGTTYLPYPVNSNPTFKCSKASMFGSYDPNQRPV